MQNDRAAAEALWQQLGQGAAAGSLTPAALSLAVTRLALQVRNEGVFVAGVHSVADLAQQTCAAQAAAASSMLLL